MKLNTENIMHSMQSNINEELYSIPEESGGDNLKKLEEKNDNVIAKSAFNIYAIIALIILLLSILFHLLVGNKYM